MGGEGDVGSPFLSLVIKIPVHTGKKHGYENKNILYTLNTVFTHYFVNIFVY